METNAQKMKMLLTKNVFSVDVLVNTFNLETLNLIQQASVSLEASLECERLLLSSVEVKAIVMDDIRTVQKNKAVVKSAMKLKELNFEDFCFN